MVRDPRMVFEQLFGSGGTPEQRAQRRATDRSILDMLTSQMADLRRSLGAGGPAAPGSVLDQPPGDRAAHRAHRSPQHERRGARAARCAGRRAGCVRRTRQADVRSAGARVLVGHDARVLVQDGPRRFRSRLSGQRRRSRVPRRVASRHGRGTHPAVRRDQQVPRLAAAVLPREAAEHDGRRGAICSTRRSCSTDRRWPSATRTTTAIAR